MLAWAAGRVARWRPAVRLHGSMMLPIGPRKQPAARALRSRAHTCGRAILLTAEEFGQRWLRDASG